MGIVVFVFVLLAVAAEVVAEAPARGTLVPHEVGVIALDVSRESRYVAEYYAKARKIPPSNICRISGKPVENLSREDWERHVRPEILAWMEQDGRRDRIRCLVTCWDVPLRIDRRSDSVPEVVARKAALGRAKQDRLKLLAELLDALDAVGAVEKPPARTPFDSSATAATLAGVFETAIKNAQKRAASLPADQKKKADQVLEKVFLAGGGIASIVGLAGRREGNATIPADVGRRLELAQAELAGLQKGLQALSALPDTPARDAQILNLAQQTNGVLGALQWIDEQQQLLEKNETQASFDSELSLLLWPEYPLFLWTLNPLHYSFDALGGKLPTLMVSRLAAPKVELVTKLIDASIAVEKTGLEGKVYLDARGLAYNPDKDKGAGYARYDQSLRDLAQRLIDHTKLEVFLNNDEKLFAPGSCPDAALYCGWYALANYVDAFAWRPGAVGYHIASLEAANLRSPDAKNWCPAMLARGVAATLGPVNEPYLSAFPLPDDFFSLLLTGRYALVEVFYRTKPFNSWQMVLIGDPLYNPFKNRPLLLEDDLPEGLRPKR